MASLIRASDGDEVLGGRGSRRGRWRRVPLFVWASAAFMSVVILVAACPPLVSPYDPIQQSLPERLKSPTWFPEAG